MTSFHQVDLSLTVRAPVQLAIGENVDRAVRGERSYLSLILTIKDELPDLHRARRERQVNSLNLIHFWCFSRSLDDDQLAACGDYDIWRHTIVEVAGCQSSGFRRQSVSYRSRSPRATRVRIDQQLRTARTIDTNHQVSGALPQTDVFREHRRDVAG